VLLFLLYILIMLGTPLSLSLISHRETKLPFFITLVVMLVSGGLLIYPVERDGQEILAYMMIPIYLFSIGIATAIMSLLYVATTEYRQAEGSVNLFV